MPALALTGALSGGTASATGSAAAGGPASAAVAADRSATVFADEPPPALGAEVPPCGATASEFGVAASRMFQITKGFQPHKTTIF